jgi:hypothetical protein
MIPVEFDPVARVAVAEAPDEIVVLPEEGAMLEIQIDGGPILLESVLQFEAG